MSSIELSTYLQQRMTELYLSNTEVAKRAKVSRRTWYRLLNNNSNNDESKLSTLMGVSKALNTDVMYLLSLSLSPPLNPDKNSESVSKKQMKIPPERGLNNALQAKNEKICKVGESFIKTWRVINLSKKNWWGMRLACLDPDTHSAKYPTGLCFIAKQKEIAIPNTKIGQSVEISVQLTAPHYPGRITSAWQLVDNEGNAYTEHGNILQCTVHVMSI